MPDPLLLLAVMLSAGAMANAVVLHCARPWRSVSPTGIAIGEAHAMGLAFYLGYALLGRWPRLPPLEAGDRLLVVLLPALVLVEIIATLRAVPGWLAWTLRLVLALGATPILLYGSRYLTDSAGPGTRLWTPMETAGWLGTLAVALATMWVLLFLLARRTPGRSLSLAVALACAGAAPTIMLSGYATGGQLLVPVAGALVGTVAASRAWNSPHGAGAAVGLGIVLLFSLLVMGLFLAELSLTHAALLFFAPLLAWVPEGPLLRRMRPWGRGLLRIVLVAVPVTFVVWQALEPPTAKEAAPAQPGEPSPDDYRQFGR